MFTFPIVSMLGLIVGVGGNLFLAAAAGDPGSIGVVITGGGAGIVVSVMALILKKVMSGELVPVPISRLVEAGAERDKKLDRVLDILMADRSEHKSLVKEATEANFAVYEFLRSSGASTKTVHPGAAPKRSEGDTRNQ